MKKFPVWLTLAIITLVAGALLGVTNGLTEGRIAEGALIAAETARKTMFPDADEFEQMELPEVAPVDYVYAAKAGGEILGYVSQVTVKGYGGEIEVTLGVKPDGTLTGVTCGGANFSETAGLGAKVKEPAFSDQFIGLTLPAVLKGNVDSVTGASRSSGAVVDGVNIAADYIEGQYFG